VSVALAHSHMLPATGARKVEAMDDATLTVITAIGCALDAALAAVRPASRQAGDHPAGDLATWTAGNHVRAAAAL
jgi:uncharacterized membrane protein